jgi:sugar/nucleoside kinase (ribokinase family)
VLKRGRRGVVVRDGAAQQELPAPPVAVLDSTGAGDAFAAGFLLGGGLEPAARRGLAAAARCLQRPGSMPPPLERELHGSAA